MELLNPIAAALEQCVVNTELELDKYNKKDRNSIKRIKSSIKYLNYMIREIDKLIISEAEL